jgi:hypothetical protein
MVTMRPCLNPRIGILAHPKLRGRTDARVRVGSIDRLQDEAQPRRTVFLFSNQLPFRFRAVPASGGTAARLDE